MYMRIIYVHVHVSRWGSPRAPWLIRLQALSATCGTDSSLCTGSPREADLADGLALPKAGTAAQESLGRRSSSAAEPGQPLCSATGARGAQCAPRRVRPSTRAGQELFAPAWCRAFVKRPANSDLFFSRWICAKDSFATQSVACLTAVFMR